MNDKLFILIAAAVFFFAVLILALALASMRSRMRELELGIDSSRREISDSLMHNSSATASALSDNAEMIDRRIDALREGVEKRLEAIRVDNNTQLERMRTTVDEKLQTTLDERISRSFASVRESLDKVYSGLGEMQNLAAGVGDLSKVLSNVKTRGMIGEIQLGAILSQILSPEQYLENVSTVPGSSDRVEYAVKMPGDGENPVLLPIDAKFPADAYARLMDAYDSSDSLQISEARKLLITRMKTEAKGIHEKYVRVPYTTDFGVLFLPFEGLYAEAVNMGLMEELQSTYRIMIAGPSTMAALLNSLQMGFRTLAIQKNAGEVWKILGNVKSEFDKFADVLAATQQRLDQANRELDKLVGTRTRQIQRALGKVQRLEDRSGGLLELESVEEYVEGEDELQ